MADIKKVVERYNRIMDGICGTSHLLIGCNSELDNEKDTKNRSDVELTRIMVEEMEWQLYRLTDSSMLMNELKEEDPKAWRSIVGKVERFINRYK